MERKFKPKMSIWRFLALGYLVVVLVGSGLLMLPFASRGGSTSYIDALFTSASATCVTGLVPFDTNTHWTLFGQIVILLLIQTGGLGFTTFITLLLMVLRRGLGLYERNAMIRSIGGSRLEGVKKLVRRIIIGTFAIELCGAGLLSIRFIRDFGALKGIYIAVFHAVSAFCNAGFDVMGGLFEGASSLQHYATDPLVVLTVCALIIVGGLGFCVWGDIAECKFNLKKCQFYTHLILIATGLLLFISTGLFLLFERNSPALEGYSFGGRVLAALFNSTTARTAGFYTTDPAMLSESGYLLTIILMTIGGCSGSTAGGIKVGTFIIIVMGMVSVLRGKRDILIGKRRVDISQLGQAFAIFTAFLALVLTSTIAICAIEPTGHFREALFETVSALGTVGLSVSVETAAGLASFTTTLSAASKIILIVLMYTGRVGFLTIAAALGRRRSEPQAQVRRPVETIFIG